MDEGRDNDEQPDQVNNEEVADEEEDDVVQMAGRAFLDDIEWLGNRNDFVLDGQDEEESNNGEEEPDVPEGERVNFDMEATTSHQYLHADQDIDENTKDYWIEGTDPIQLPVIRQDVVCLPGQVVPIHTIFPSDRQAVRSALDNKTYLALQTCLESHRHGWYVQAINVEMTEAHGEIGTLLAPRQISDDGNQIKAIMIGKQRCRFLSFERSITGALIATVVVVPDTVRLPLINVVCPNSLLKQNIQRKRRWAQANGVSLLAADIVSLEHNCKILSDWMHLWYSENQIKATLQQGPENFSFWVAMNIPARLKEKYEYLEQDCVDLRIMTLVKMVRSLTEIVCKHCDQKISNLDKIIKMSIQSTSGIFVNNYGIIHEMLTVSEAENIHHVDIPRSQYTWFPGYRWQIINCRECGKHIGWEFTSKRLNPSRFYGLTRSGIKPRNENDSDLPPERETLADSILRVIQSAPQIEHELHRQRRL